MSGIRETRKEKVKGKQIIIRGENRINLIAACIYYGSKMQKDPRTKIEIANICNLNVTRLTIGCNKFMDILYLDRNKLYG